MPRIAIQFVGLYIFIVLVGRLSFPPSPGLSQETLSSVISSPPSPVGSGARAAGIGNAFIAVADDGRRILESCRPRSIGAPGDIRCGFLLPTKRPTGHPNDYRRGRPVSYGGHGPDGECDLNFLSGVLPFDLFDRNFTVSVSYQRKLDFNRATRLQPYS